MAKQPESRLQKDIRSRLEKEVGGFWFKMWGGPFTLAGLPDLIGCVEGRFFALEVKLPNKSSSKPSKIQKAIMARIRKAGGISQVVRSPEEAIHVVNQALEKSKAGIQIRQGQVRSRPSMRTTYGKNLHHIKAYRELEKEAGVRVLRASGDSAKQ